MMMVTPSFGDLEILSPLNRAHPHAAGLLAMWIATPGLLGGTRWYDLVAGQVATLTSMAFPPTSTSGWGAGTVCPGAAGELRLDGTDDWADAGNGAALQVTGDLTLMGWGVRKAAGYRGFVGKLRYTGVYQGYAIFLNPSNQYEFLIGSGAGDDYSAGHKAVSAAHSDTNWHHIAATRIGTAVAIYVDGKLEGSGTSAGLVDSTESFMIGRQYSSGAGPGYYSGLGNDFRLYTRGWTAGQIAGIYQETALGCPTLLNWLDVPVSRGAVGTLFTQSLGGTLASSGVKPGGVTKALAGAL